ncbi:AAA domain-containing protein [Selenomonas sp. F0473]|uniref:AAA domain-containing protein n=1 Tax=Selenomonas sp. F0473 TaxID=999423 RepID=UPI00029DEF6A|nr:AAA domain-containing protein [Selenomonas sp. F0473]EKU70546.1 hypothetical protein HMPREF9161_01592 [Selenomonas sp. F0473]
MNEKTKENTLALFEYVKKIKEQSRRVITDIMKYDKIYDPRELAQRDPEHIHIYFRENDSSSEERESFVLFEVEQPELHTCPRPPASIVDWLAADWERLSTERVGIRKQITSTTSMSEFITEDFIADQKRVKAFHTWNELRNQWRVQEQKRRNTKRTFDDLYSIYQEMRDNLDGMELVVGNGDFRCREMPAKGEIIDHPLLLRKVRLQYHKQKRSIQIVDTDEQTEFYDECLKYLDDIPGLNQQHVREYIQENDPHPMDADIETVLRHIASELTPECHFIDKKEKSPKLAKYYLEEDIRIFRRQPKSGMIQLLNGVIQKIKDGAELAPGLEKIVEEREGEINKDESVNNYTDDSVHNIYGEAEDLYLTKPANEEQIAVARLIEREPAVVVQGPPGTGKTHTIANLMGHFLAQGKRVLVTSFTPKALRVLKDKLPKNIQCLCVSTLEDGHADMEQSVDGICQVMSTKKVNDLFSKAHNLEKRRRTILSELQSNREKLLRIRKLELRHDAFVFDGKGYSLSDMAKFIAAHETYDFIPGDVREGAPFPLTADETENLAILSQRIDADVLRELGNDMPCSSDVPHAMAFAQWLSDSERIRYAWESVLSEVGGVTCSSDGGVLFHGKPVMREFHAEEFDALCAWCTQQKLTPETELWVQDAILAGRQGGGRLEVWNRLGETIRESRQKQEESRAVLFGKTIVVESSILYDDRIKKALGELFNEYGENATPSKVKLLMHRDWKWAMEGIKIDGDSLNGREAYRSALLYLELTACHEQVRKSWNALMVPLGAKSYESMEESDDDTDDLCAAEWTKIDQALHWYEEVFCTLKNMAATAGIDTEVLFPQDDAALTPKAALDRDITWMHSEWPKYLELFRLYYVEEAEIQDRIRSLINILGQYTGGIGRALLNAVQSGDVEEYRAHYEKLVQYEALIPSCKQRNELIQKIYPVAELWANSLSQGTYMFTMEHAHMAQDAWKYKQFALQLENMRTEDSIYVEGRIWELTEELHMITGDLAELLTWGHLLRRIEGTDIDRALQFWKQSVRKLGKGTGKKAGMYRSEAKKHMQKVQPAVPAWIMSIEQVWNNLSPESERFDIVIVDESSQADITALPLFYYGNRVIIVGDDEQVSPSFSRIPDDELKKLQEQTIVGKIENARLLDLKTSLYDIANSNFERRMLCEHFRCVPEIIGYSNRLSYHNQIQPLRESGSSGLKPVISYRVDGHRDNNDVNKKEAETIVALIAACCQQKEYEGKTIGVISMLGTAQAYAVNQAVAEYLPFEQREACNFLVGSPAEFQGDERDVIFLSLVDSNETPGKKMRLQGFGADNLMKKRYNVAVSRARDQLWVIHSMGLADLKEAETNQEGDIRRGLLDYVENAADNLDELMTAAQRAESEFEKRVVQGLLGYGYHLEQQVRIGGYRLDIAVEYQGKKIAVECDGDRFHSTDEQLASDLKRQSQLERLGWRFIRIRGSEFFRAPKATLERVHKELAHYGIFPEKTSSAIGDKQRDELFERVKIRAQELLVEWGLCE